MLDQQVDRNAPSRPDEAWWQAGVQAAPVLRPVQRSSFYIRMRDGVRLAVDQYLPADLRPGSQIPTILQQTRYYRRTEIRWPFTLFRRGRDRVPRWIRRFGAAGYAVIVADVRGTGASFGSRQIEMGPEEVLDGYDLVEWICDQPWSDGAVGAMGISYLGATAELLVTNCHPAVKAAVPMFIQFDAYTDSFAPGGVRNHAFLHVWNDMNRAMDANRMSSFTRRKISFLGGLAIRGVAPVDGDGGRALLRAAVREHAANADLDRAARGVEFRDDTAGGNLSFDVFSPSAKVDQLRQAAIPLYSWTGWFDAGFIAGGVKRFNTVRTPGSRLLIGPWDHAALSNPNPCSPDGKVYFDMYAEVLRFFDLHLKGIQNSIAAEKPVHYYTMGAESWRESSTWPPEGFAAQDWYFGPGAALTPQPPAAAGSTRYPVSFESSSGRNSRWFSMVNFKAQRTQYADRAEQDQHLAVFETEPLARALEVTGHPVITLWVRVDQPDTVIIVYLEEVTPSGDVHYLTEGWFRAVHRKLQLGQHPQNLPVPWHTFRRADALPLIPGQPGALTFDLLPTSYLFKAGSRIRIAVAGADKHNVLPVTAVPPVIEILHGGEHASHVRLPVKPA